MILATWISIAPRHVAGQELSGTIRYGGSLGTVSAATPIGMFLFSGSPPSVEVVAHAVISTNPGAFALQAPVGQYHLAYYLDFLHTFADDPDQPRVGAPFQFYDHKFVPSGDLISVPQAGINLQFDDSQLIPGIAGEVTYTGNRGACLVVEAFADPSLTQFAGNYSLSKCVQANALYEQVFLNPGQPYYLRAFVDLNNNNQLDPGEPFTIYCGKDAPPGAPVVASAMQTNVNFSFNDQGTGGCTEPAPACVGDCNDHGQVTVDEILTMVNIALGNTPITSCGAGDANHDNQITVDEILTAVNNALNGCPAGSPTATPMPTATPLPVGPPNANIDQTSSYTRSKMNGMGFGDFNGDGILDFVEAGISGSTGTVPIHIRKGIGGGEYQEATSEIIKGAVPGTVHARKILVADLNNDGWDDIYIADHGYDQPPFPGAKDVLLLSDAAGHLVWAADQQEPVGFHHAATAGDIDNRGRVSIFVTDTTGPGPYFLVNDGSGNFAVDASRVPASLIRPPMFTAELIDIDRDGYLDLVVGGHEPEGMTTSIFWGNGSGAYEDGDRTDLPADSQFGIVLDIDAEDVNGDGLRDIVLTRTSFDPFYVGFYFQILIQKSKRTFVDESLPRLIKDRSTWIGTNRGWIAWIRLIDFNGDGFPDIVQDAPGFVFTNDGQGYFSLLQQ